MVKYIEQTHEILTLLNVEMLKLIERAGRVCYKSEDKITENSYLDFAKMIIKRQHLSVIEHVNVTVWFKTCRGVTHEMVRHRIASYSQESTRYCNYSKGKYGGEITVIDHRKYLNGQESVDIWLDAIEYVEKAYLKLIERGNSPQIARDVLPNVLKTEIEATMNLREWGHVFKLRTSESAHPCMKDLMLPVLEEFRAKLPVIFDDLSIYG